MVVKSDEVPGLGTNLNAGIFSDAVFSLGTNLNAGIFSDALFSHFSSAGCAA